MGAVGDQFLNHISLESHFPSLVVPPLISFCELIVVSIVEQQIASCATECYIF